MPIPPIPAYAAEFFPDCTSGQATGTPTALTAEDILGALSGASTTTLQGIAETIGGYVIPTSSGVAAAIGSATGIDQCTIANAVAGYMVTCESVCAGTEVAPTGTGTQITVGGSDSCPLKLELQLGDDVVNVPTEVDTVTAYTCGNPEPADQLIQFVSETGFGGVNNKALYQKILDMLGALLQCCSPCVERLDSRIVNLIGSDTVNLNDYIFKTVWNFTDAPDPKLIEFGTPPVIYWGKVRFADVNGKAGELIFLNSAHCVIYPNIPLATQVEYIMEWGATGTMQVSLKKPWVWTAGI